MSCPAIYDTECRIWRMDVEKMGQLTKALQEQVSQQKVMKLDDIVNTLHSFEKAHAALPGERFYEAVEAVALRGVNLTPWEVEFINNIQKMRIFGNRILSGKQRAVIIRLYWKYKNEPFGDLKRDYQAEDTITQEAIRQILIDEE